MDEIKVLLESHFGDPRDLSFFISDLQRMRPLNNKSPLTFSARLQTHLAITKQVLTVKENQAEFDLIESMALNNFFNGFRAENRSDSPFQWSWTHCLCYIMTKTRTAVTWTWKSKTQPTSTNSTYSQTKSSSLSEVMFIL